MSLEVSENQLDAIIRAAIEKHGDQRDAVIPILGEINQALGYIPGEALGKIRRCINTPEEGLFLADSHLYSIASFYHMYSLKPVGRHIVRYCESAPCHVVGGRQVIQRLHDFLGLAPGETSADGRWTLFQTSCLGICSVGPVIVVDDDIYGHVTPQRVSFILAKYR
ncbi:MAG: NAD(P)H-dependent oxidoreductase subunit E [Anaerolineales bacterium]|jgi:NADH:ubiquinone oxidoreductase subunit E|nr:NAD(P)H-dependent oxidoreductase subunit E [Anaerolineales bacterium]